MRAATRVTRAVLGGGGRAGPSVVETPESKQAATESKAAAKALADLTIALKPAIDAARAFGATKTDIEAGKAAESSLAQARKGLGEARGRESAIKGGLEEAPEEGTGIAGALGGVAAAAGAAVVGFEMLFGMIKQWVGALNPGVLQLFQQQMSNLQATLGQAFMPVVLAATDLIHRFADALSPIMQQLEPIVEQFTDIVSAGVAKNIQFMADSLERLLPILKLAVDLFEPLNAMMQVQSSLLQAVMSPIIFSLSLFGALIQPLLPVLKLFTALLDRGTESMAVWTKVFDAVGVTIGQLLESLVQTVAAFFGVGKIGDIIDQLTEWFRKVIKQLVVFVATLAKMFGADKLLDNLIEAFTPKKGGEEAVAAGQTSIKGLEQISKDLALAAAQAQGTTKTDKDQEQLEYMKSIADAIKDVKDNGKTLIDFLKQDVVEPVKVWAGEKLEVPLRAIVSATEFVKEPIQSISAAAIRTSEFLEGIKKKLVG